MTDDEQKIADAVARAFETLSERLSRELSDAFNQMAQQIGRVQKQQLEIVDLVGRQAAATSAREKIRDGDIERQNEYARAIEQLSQAQMKIAQFIDGLATQRANSSARCRIAWTPSKRRRSVRITTRSSRRRL